MLNVQAANVGAPKQVALGSDLNSLVQALRSKGFTVLFQHPPRKDTYGQFYSKNKTLYVSPLAFELGIGRQVLIHEAIHAVQSCPSGRLTLLGWKLSAPVVVQREINRILLDSYHSNEYLEKEAFTGQSSPNAVPWLLRDIKKRC